MVEHSPQAVAAYPDDPQPDSADYDWDVDVAVQVARTAYDRGRAEALAEKRTVNREALVAVLLGTVSLPTWYEVADAILAMPDSPLVADREAVDKVLAQYLYNSGLAQPGTASAWADLITAALFESGVIRSSSEPTAPEPSTLNSTGDES